MVFPLFIFHEEFSQKPTAGFLTMLNLRVEEGGLFSITVQHVGRDGS